jgi:hypothetical protein
MHETSKPDRARPGGRRRRALAAVVAAVAAVATLSACSDDGGRDSGGEHARTHRSASAPTTSPETATPATTPPATTPPATAPPTTDPPAPAPATPVAATTPPAPAPTRAPILADGRHPVYLTDVDVAGATLQFDLLQYLVGDAAEAYEEAHPDEYPEGEDYDESPFHNDNPRLRRLAVVADVPVFVQGRITGCDGPHTTTFAALAAYVGRIALPGSGHLGHQPFWLTVEDGIVVDIAEIGCAG